MTELRESTTAVRLPPRSTWLILLVLLLVAVPWYWRYFPARAVVILFGMPTWVAVSIAGAAAISTYTAWLLLSHRWPGEDEGGEHRVDNGTHSSSRENGT